jgi:hypothetical protein
METARLVPGRGDCGALFGNWCRCARSNFPSVLKCPVPIAARGHLSMHLFGFVSFVAFACVSIGASQAQTKQIGNWIAIEPHGKPSVVVLLPSTDKRGTFAIRCFQDERRWSVQFVVPSVNFDRRLRFRLDLRSPNGATHSIALVGADDKHQLYAFFDSDKAGVFEVARWFTIFDKIKATITPDFPDPPVTMDFETTGGVEATRLPLQKCAPR